MKNGTSSCLLPLETEIWALRSRGSKLVETDKTVMLGSLRSLPGSMSVNTILQWMYFILLFLTNKVNSTVYVMEQNYPLSIMTKREEVISS